jgi:hypothetical protein
MTKRSSVVPPAWQASQYSSSHTLGLVSPSYLGTLVGARKCEGNFTLRMLWPKARGPLWFGDQLRLRLSSLSWRRPRPRSSWWRERLSWWLSTLLAHHRASRVFCTSRLGPRQLLTADTAAPPPLLVLSMLERRRVRAVCGRRSCPPALRALA